MEILWPLENNAELSWGKRGVLSALFSNFSGTVHLALSCASNEEKMHALGVSGGTVPLCVSPEVQQSSSEQSCFCDSRSSLPILVCSAHTAPSKGQCVDVSAKRKVGFTGCIQGLMPSGKPQDRFHPGYLLSLVPHYQFARKEEWTRAFETQGILVPRSGRPTGQPRRPALACHTEMIPRPHLHQVEKQ